MDNTADLPSAAVTCAARLAGAVHEEGAGEVAAILHPLTRQDLVEVAVALAAMVPVDYSPAELLAWNDGRHAATTAPVEFQTPMFPVVLVGPRGLKPHGTHAAFNRHKKRGEKPCRACEDGERDFQRDRRRDTRGRARDEAAS